MVDLFGCRDSENGLCLGNWPWYHALCQDAEAHYHQKVNNENWNSILWRMSVEMKPAGTGRGRPSRDSVAVSYFFITSKYVQQTP